MKLTLATLLFLLLMPLHALLAVAPAHCLAAGKPSFDGVTDKVPSRNLLHIHFNKHDYKVGETIWFKAYLVDSKTQLPDIQVANLYIELYDFSGKEILSKIYRLENGIANGDLTIDPNMPDGNYLIKAYTSLMRNYGEDFLFKKYFYISNPEYNNRISKQEIKENILFNDDLELLMSKLVLEVYPEGGNLLSGIENKLVIYLADGLGRGISDTGFIMNSSGEKVTSFSTNELGYASVPFAPLSGVKYTAVIEALNSQKITKDLSPVMTKGVNLYFNRFSADALFIDLRSAGYSGNELTLVANKDGFSIFRQLIRIKNDMESFGIPISDFPPGIVYFELLDNQGQRLSGRPIFIEKINQPFVSLNAQSLQFENQRGLNINLNLADENGKPVVGNLSVAVLAGDITPQTKDFSIYSNVMFLSEQSGKKDFLIKSNSYPFDEFLELQHLFLISGEYPFYSASNPDERKYILNEFERTYGTNIRGVVTDPNTDQPAPAVKLQMSSRMGSKRTFDAITDEKGLFEFRQLELPDSALVDIITEGVAGDARKKIDLIIPEKKQTEYEKNLFTQKQGITEKGKNWKRVKSPRTSKQAVPVSIYGNPDQTIIVGDKTVYYNMLQLLEQRAAGLMISGNSIMFRGPSSINMNNDPLYIVENIAVPRNEFLRVDPRSVHRIELFKGTSTAFFGSRGANGVIVTYLKKGEEPDKPFQEFVVSGFSTPNEFVFNINQQAEKFENGKVTTVWWEPSLNTDINGNTNLQFLLIPGITKYKIVIQGISNSGGVFSGDFILGK